ncbi:MAG TPA: hypothetical protein VNF73_10770 [Candidatus Saccharimonadales bacterium]|nr:hypothetical protein [Candidatus Saccharimonadales bacterium]
MPHLQYAPVTGSKWPGYAILEQTDDGVTVEFYDDRGQPRPDAHLRADSVEEAKKRAADACRPPIEASPEGPTDLRHWWPVPADTSNPVEYAIGHRGRHPDGRG